MTLGPQLRYKNEYYILCLLLLVLDKIIFLIKYKKVNFYTDTVYSLYDSTDDNDII